MRCVIAGSRDLGTYKNDKDRRVQKSLCECPWMELAFKQCDWSHRITEIVSGKAIGVDNLGEQLADKLVLELTIFPANWDEYGNRAGPMRNRDMAEYTDIAIVIMKAGWTSGSRDMVKQMDKRKKPVLIFEVIGGKLCQVR